MKNDSRIVHRCGSLNCRGSITEEDWKIPELQERYDSYFSWYLQEKIDRMKKTGMSSATTRR